MLIILEQHPTLLFSHFWFLHLLILKYIELCQLGGGIFILLSITLYAYCIVSAILYSLLIGFNNFAGVPAQISPSGISLVPTALAATIEYLPTTL